MHDKAQPGDEFHTKKRVHLLHLVLLFCFFIKGDRILQRKGFLNALVSCAEIIFSDDRIKDTIQKRGIAKKIILIIQTLWACFSNFITPESMTWK